MNHAPILTGLGGGSGGGGGSGSGGGGGGGVGSGGGGGVTVMPMASHLLWPQRPTLRLNHAPILTGLLSHMHENNSYVFHAPYIFGYEIIKCILKHVKTLNNQLFC
jgi:hypothetical protein